MRGTANHEQTTSTGRPLLRGAGISVLTHGGRVLIDDLNFSLSTDKVAIVGRNGVGKSSLVQVLAGRRPPDAGTVEASVAVALVPQRIEEDTRDLVRAIDTVVNPTKLAAELRRLGLPTLAQLQEATVLSRGEIRKLALLAAKHGRAGLLLLDEPGEDLDAAGKTWLTAWLRQWRGGLVVVSHAEWLLREFEHFFLMAESGCRYLPGRYDQLEETLRREREEGQQRYVRNLNALVRREERNALVRRRRLRKKNGGRVREIDRAPSRAMLNTKRSYAQKYHGKREKVREARIDAARVWAKATRRALAVNLSIDPPTRQLPADDGRANVSLSAVGVTIDARVLFEGMDLDVHRQRVAVVGANGAGKTCLLEVMLGHREPTNGRAQRLRSRIGSIAQGGVDWMLKDSLMARLVATASASSADDLARLLVAHRFPFALAERPLRTLSPGERVRAALVCLFARAPAVELLVVDEPTDGLDVVGRQSLCAVLAAWPGGLVIASHDQEFLNRLNIDRTIVLDSQRRAELR